MTYRRVGDRVSLESLKSEFIGRRTELSTLDAALQRARGGFGSIFLLSGEAGIGKTLLVREFSAFAREAGAKVLEGRASERLRDVPFSVWKQILAAQTNGLDSSPADFLPVEPPSALPASAQGQPIIECQPNQELFETAARALVECARKQALVLVFDDLHAADPQSLHAFRVLARDLSRIGSLIIGVYRDSEVKRFREFGDLLLDPLIRDCTRISLAAFDDEETREFARSRTTNSLLGEKLANLRALTGGNPRLLEIALRHDWVAETALGPTKWPGGLLRAEIEAHLEHLSIHAREVLSTASLAGASFGLSLLFHALEQDPKELLDSLYEAEQSGLLIRTEIPGTYRFRQTLVQEALAAELTGAQRARLHERFGEVMETLHKSDDAYVERIAHHFYEAALLGCAAKAAAYSSRAAAYAVSMSRIDDALRYYQMALVALELEGSNSEAIHDLKVRLQNARAGTENPSSDAHRSAVDGFLCEHVVAARPEAKYGEQITPPKPFSTARVQHSEDTQQSSPLAVRPEDAETWSEIAESTRNGTQAALSPDLMAQAVSPNQPCIFRREGDYWTLTFEGQTLRLKHSNGLLFVADLLEHPDRELHVAQLVALLPVARANYLEGLYVSHSERARLGMHLVSGKNSNPILDPTAKAEYRSRIDELRDALEQAIAFNDSAKAADLERELEFIATELSRAVGAGGRNREHRANDERARVNVTNAIRAVTAKISKEHPSLGRYLRTTIRTGRFCSYHPDPRSSPRWQF